MATAAAGPLVSIVIPCWNDASALRKILRQLANLSGVGEVIVADASSSGECSQIAHEAGATVVRCERPSRGRQMNAGARVANGELLLFQHADTEFSQPHLDALRALTPGFCGGAFHRKFDVRHRHLRWLEPWARIWAEVGGSFFGDQSIFVWRTVFEEMGGYAGIPLMEDLEFCRRLRRRGRTVLLDPPIASSPRRAQHYGPWRTTFRNGTLIALFHLGASPEVLHRWYYRLPRAGATGPEASPALPELP
jgi:rSAM/selenodomain-associated transferase 2